MKKIISLVALLALVVGITFAAFAKAPSLDGTYYLYNEETGLYMSRGAAWGTACTADYYGMPVNLQFTDMKSKIVFYDWQNTGLGVNLFTDNGAPVTFTFAGDAETGYTIFAENLDAGAGYVSVDSVAGIQLKVEADAANASKWKMLTKEEYEQKIAAKYEAECIALTADTVGNKVVDLTEKIQNAALTATDGWTWTPGRNNSSIASNANGSECYQGSGVLAQTVEGLAPGLYKVSVQAFYRDGSNADCVTRATAGYKMVNAYLEANGYRVRMKDWASDRAGDTNPNSMPDYKVLADQGKYKVEVYTVVGADGKLNIKLNEPNYIGMGWWIFSNVTLTQYVAAGEQAADGTYYLYNPETGLYMSRGSFWGTACTADYYGMPVNLAFTEMDSKIVFYDWQNTGLGANLYTDNGAPVAFTFAGDAETGYTIFAEGLDAGAGYVSVDAAGAQLKVEADAANASKWVLLTKESYEQKIAAKYAADCDLAYVQAAVDTVGCTLADLTEKIQNAALTATDGWTWTPERSGSSIASNANGSECYQGTGALTQTVEGLAPGLYKVSVQAFYRDGSNADCVTRATAGYKMVNAYLEANGFRVRMMDWASDRADDSNPNSMPDYKVLADQGKYKVEVYTVVGADGKLDIKLNEPNYIGTGWWIFSNVTLTQYVPAGKKVDATINATFAPEHVTIGETATMTIKTNSAGDITVTSVNPAIATVEGSGETWTITGVAPGVAQLKVVQAEDATHNAAEKTFEFTITEFKDITDKYIVNGNLLKGTEGWTCTPSNPGKADNGHIGALEFYAGWSSLDLTSYSMLQTIKLPAGQYRLNSNAFYRYKGAYSDDPTKSEAYMQCGTSRTLLPTLGSIPGLSTYADDMAQALAAFEQGLYATHTDFKVLEDDTEIQIGYVGTHSEMKSWFISGPLRLEYIGEVSVQGYIDDIKAALETVPEGKMETALQEALDLAVEGANKILVAYEADPTGVSAKDANDACEALRAAIIAAEPSIKIYKNIMDALDKALALDEDGQKKFNELTADVQTAYEAGTITDGVAEMKVIEAALIEGVKAQTTIGSDWSLLGSNKKDAWFGASGTYQTGVELYTGDNVPAKDTILLSQTITGLMPNAKYEVKFYATANVARTLTEENYGEGIAYVFANGTKQDIVVNHNAAETLVADSLLRTFEAAVGADGKLEFGLGNKKEGGQWYIAQFVSLKLLDAPQGLSRLILAGVADKAAGETLTIDLNKGEEYPLNVAVDAGLVNLVINGNGAIVNVGAGAQITGMQGIEINNVNFNCADATVAPVALSAAPDSAVHASKGDFYGNQQNAYVDTCAIVFNGCNFAQLPTSLVSNNKAAWVLGGLTIDNCVVQFCKSDDNPYIDFQNAPGVGAIKNFTINASTLFNDSIDDIYFIRFNNSSNVQATKAFPADPKEYITFTNNTFVNICTGTKNFGNNGPNSKECIIELKGNVFFNVYRLNKYIQGNSTWNFTAADNAINGDIVTIDATDKSKIATEDLTLVLTLPEGALDFNNIMALKANFTAPAGSYAAEKGFGDPRWITLPPITEPRKWDFSNIKNDYADEYAAIWAAADYWSDGGTRATSVVAYDGEELTIDGTTKIGFTEGLFWTAAAGKLLIGDGSGNNYKCIQTQKGVQFYIPQVAAGDTVKIVCCAPSKSGTFTFENATPASIDFGKGSSYTEYSVVMTADGEFVYNAPQDIRLQTIAVIPATGIVDGINEVNNKITVPFAEGIFNLRGQKVSTMKTGEIYIVNGKKFIAR